MENFALKATVFILGHMLQ